MTAPLNQRSRRSGLRLPALVLCLALAIFSSHAAGSTAILKPKAFAHHIEHFNTMEPETVVNAIPNAKSWSWLQQNIPLFECSDPTVEETYYFRWWSFRKHLKKTSKGYVITEFLTPVSHADEFNAISCATGFHISEGRWLHENRYVDDYAKFWLLGNDGQPAKKFHGFSSWFAAALWDRYLVNGDQKFLIKLLPALVADYHVWEQERQLTNGLFWQFDVRDGMEESISGSRRNQNIRPTINTYMFANARALADLADLAHQSDLAVEFNAKAQRLKKLTEETLWDSEAHFFKVLIATNQPDNSAVAYKFANVREAIGFVPWMFALPDANPRYGSAWLQATDPEGFAAPFGLTTAERRHPQFRSHGVGTCEWDGAVWPFATCQTLYGWANYLRSQQQYSSASYFAAFLTYTRSQRAGGLPYIGEYLDETTGDWINGKNDRSRYYNHSTYADLLITGIIGLQPRRDDTVEIAPLLPPDAWEWFAIDGLRYHGRTLTILWDQTGRRYGRGAGLILLVNGKELARAETLSRITATLP